MGRLIRSTIGIDLSGHRARRVAALVGAVGVVVALAVPAGTTAAHAGPGEVAQAASPSPTPPGREVDVSTCGGYTVRVVTPTGDGVVDGGPTSITVTAPDGTTVLDWSGTFSIDGGQWVNLGWCGDVDGDGHPELYYQIATQDADFDIAGTNIVLRLGGAGGELLRVESDDAFSTLTPVRLGKGPAYELTIDDDALRGWPGLGDDGYPFPSVYALRDGKYVLATRDYPAYLRKARARAVRDLATCIGRPAPDAQRCRRGTGLRVEAIDLLLGAPTAGISRLPIPLADRRWILAQRAKLRKLLG